MPTRDEAVGAVVSAASDLWDTAHDQGETDGKQQQADDDAGVISGLRADLDAANVRIKELEQAQEPPPPPPPVDPPPTKPGLLLGASFPGKTDEAYFDGDVARLYVPVGTTDLRKFDTFMRAYDDHGVRRFALSWKDTDTKAVAACVKTVPGDVTKWWGINHHEPEDDIADQAAGKGGFTLAQWLAWQKAHLPIIRDAGGTPTICLMQWTLETGSHRRPADYDVSDLADAAWFDYYPPKATGQDAAIARMRKYVADCGFKSWGIGEYAVPRSTSSTWGPGAVTDFRTKLAATDCEAACYWPSQKNDQAVNYHFTQQTADAWFK